MPSKREREAEGGGGGGEKKERPSALVLAPAGLADERFLQILPLLWRNIAREIAAILERGDTDSVSQLLEDCSRFWRTCYFPLWNQFIITQEILQGLVVISHVLKAADAVLVLRRLLFVLGEEVIDEAFIDSCRADIERVFAVLSPKLPDYFRQDITRNIEHKICSGDDLDERKMRLLLLWLKSQPTSIQQIDTEDLLSRLNDAGPKYKYLMVRTLGHLGSCLGDESTGKAIGKLKFLIATSDRGLLIAAFNAFIRLAFTLPVEHVRVQSMCEFILSKPGVLLQIAWRRQNNPLQALIPFVKVMSDEFVSQLFGIVLARIPVDDARLKLRGLNLLYALYDRLTGGERSQLEPLLLAYFADSKTSSPADFALLQAVCGKLSAGAYESLLKSLLLRSCFEQPDLVWLDSILKQLMSHLDADSKGRLVVDLKKQLQVFYPASWVLCYQGLDLLGALGPSLQDEMMASLRFVFSLERTFPEKDACKLYERVLPRLAEENRVAIKAEFITKLQDLFAKKILAHRAVSLLPYLYPGGELAIKSGVLIDCLQKGSQYHSLNEKLPELLLVLDAAGKELVVNHLLVCLESPCAVTRRAISRGLSVVDPTVLQFLPREIQVKLLGTAPCDNGGESIAFERQQGQRFLLSLERREFIRASGRSYDGSAAGGGGGAPAAGGR
jgi:hypothetical protein